MKYKTLLFVAFLFSFFCFSNEINKKKFLLKSDNDKVSFFRNLTEEEKKENIVFFENEFKHLLKKHKKNELLQKQYLLALGLTHQISNKNLEAISKFNTLLNENKYTLSNKDCMDIYVAMQECYLKLNLYSKVFEINSKINYLIKSGEAYPLWRYNIQSRLYLQIHEYDKAILQLKKEINLLYSNKKRDSLIIPSAFNDLGFYYYLKKDNNNALKNYLKSIKIAEISLKNDTKALINFKINTLGNIAKLYLDTKNYEKSIAIISKDILPFLNKNDIDYTSNNLILGEAYLQSNQIQKTKEIINAINITKFKNELKVKLEFLDLQSSYYKKIGNYKKSLEYITEIKNLKDSLLTVQNLNLLKSTELNYLIENKEKEVINKNEIIEEKEKTILIIIIIGLFALLITLLFGYFFNKKKRKEIEKMNNFISKKNEEINISLNEKELLLKEIHHRVKNNLQVISGILTLQNKKINDKKAKQILLESQERIQTIALLHKSMYQNNNFNYVSFKEYIDELLIFIKQTNSLKTQNIEITTEIDNIKLSIDTALPLSLIINEILTNCYKHAFKPNTKGKIDFKIKRLENNLIKLSLQDNGAGFEDNFNPEISDSLGFELIYGLCAQIEGKIKITNNNGAKIAIIFKEN